MITRYYNNYSWTLLKDWSDLSHNYLIGMLVLHYLFIQGVSTNVQMICAIMEHPIKYIKHSVLWCLGNKESKTYHTIKYFWWFTSKSSLKKLVKKCAGWDFVLISWNYNSLPTYDWKWCSLILRCFVCGLNLCTFAILIDLEFSSKTLQCTLEVFV